MSAPSDRAELTLRYESCAWRAFGNGVDISRCDLADLDAAIVRAFARHGGAKRVHVRFDASSLPPWLRQYQSHYFNYVLRIDEGPST